MFPFLHNSRHIGVPKAGRSWMTPRHHWSGVFRPNGDAFDAPLPGFMAKACSTVWGSSLRGLKKGQGKHIWQQYHDIAAVTTSLAMACCPLLFGYSNVPTRFGLIPNSASEKSTPHLQFRRISEAIIASLMSQQPICCILQRIRWMEG